MATQKAPERKRKISDFLSVLKKYNISAKSDAHSIRLALEELGPTYIKLGQLISSQSDVFPPELCEELGNLRDEVAPMSSEEVNQILFEAYGRSKEEVFAYFDEEAHGSASIAQVHHAKLLTGEDVAVKIQRVGAYESMEADIAFLRRLVRRIPFVKNNPYVDVGEVLDELSDITHHELDFSNEAKNLQRFYELNEDLKYVTCPKPYPELSSPKVLVMEYVKGIKVSDQDSLLAGGYDLTEIGRKYMHSFFKQLLTDGFFQADPHIGNLKICGGQIVWYDMGMMGEFSESDKDAIFDAIEGLATEDTTKVYDAVTHACVFRGKYDKEALFRDVSDFVTTVGRHGVENLDISKEIQKLMRITKTHHAGFNPAYTMMARAIATAQGTVTRYFPGVNYFDEFKKFVISFQLSEAKNRTKDTDIERLKKLRTMKKITQIPENLAGMVEQYSKGLSPVRIEMGVPEKSQGFILEIIRMLVDGLIIVALIVSSSIIVMSRLQPLVWGIPLLGFIGYCIALLMVLFHIIRSLRKK